jgi:hypothetical protein
MHIKKSCILFVPEGQDSHLFAVGSKLGCPIFQGMEDLPEEARES